MIFEFFKINFKYFEIRFEFIEVTFEFLKNEMMQVYDEDLVYSLLKVC